MDPAIQKNCFSALTRPASISFPGLPSRLGVVPAHHKNAIIRGSWKRVPGDAQLFAALAQTSRHASDWHRRGSGAANARSAGTSRQISFPVMRILQFAFGDGDYHRPYVYPRRCVALYGHVRQRNHRRLVRKPQSVQQMDNGHKCGRSSVISAKSLTGLSSARFSPAWP